MLWFFNSNFQVLWKSILCFMFPCWNFTMHLQFQEKSMIPFHLLKSMVNKNMKWKTFWIQGFVIINSNILFIGMGMMWVNAFGNQWKTYKMQWRRCMSLIDVIQTRSSLFFVELVARKGGDVTYTNAMEFIHLKVHPWFVINLYPIFNLFLFHF